MPTPGFGFLGTFQFAREATWGTKPTITKRFPFFKANARPVLERIRPQLLDGGLSMFPTVSGPQGARLSLTIPVTYSHWNLLWDLILGTSTYGSNGGTTTGIDPYTHTFGYSTGAGFKNLANSLAAEIVMGNISASTCAVVTGQKIISAKFRCSAGMSAADQILTCDLEFFGKRFQDAQSPTSIGIITTPNLDYVMFQHLTELWDGSQAGVTGNLTQSFELNVETGMSEDRVFMEGTGFVAEPHRKAKPKITWSVTKEFQDLAGLDAYIANTKGVGQATFVLDSNRYLKITTAHGLMQSPDAPIEGEGFIQQKFVWESEDAGGSTPSTMGVEVKNHVATITA